MKILADYNEIRTTGTLLHQEADTYDGLMNQMLARMHELQAVWQGSDSQAFIGQLEALRPRMEQLRQAIDSYADLLIHNAAAYETLQANRTANARLL